MLSSHTCTDISSDRLPSCFPTEILFSFFFYPSYFVSWLEQELFPYSKTVQTVSRVYPALYSMGSMVPPLGVKRSGCEVVDHTPQSGAEI